VAKVGDLGLSKMLQSTISELPMGGTLAFAAPEVLLNMRCNEKVLPSRMALAHFSHCSHASICMSLVNHSGVLHSSQNALACWLLYRSTPWLPSFSSMLHGKGDAGKLCLSHVLARRQTYSPSQLSCGPSARRRCLSGATCALSG
jgi:hypothetical protein